MGFQKRQAAIIDPSLLPQPKPSPVPGGLSIEQKALRAPRRTGIDPMPSQPGGKAPMPSQGLDIATQNLSPTEGGGGPNLPPAMPQAPNSSYLGMLKKYWPQLAAGGGAALLLWLAYRALRGRRKDEEKRGADRPLSYQQVRALSRGYIAYRIRKLAEMQGGMGGFNALGAGTGASPSAAVPLAPSFSQSMSPGSSGLWNTPSMGKAAFYKRADLGQAETAKLGPLQHAYIADALGAEAAARAMAQAKDHPAVEEGAFNEWMASGAGGAEPIYRRIRHAASRLAEKPKTRLLARFDPTTLLSDNPDVGLVSLLSGTGKKDPEREALVARRYKNLINPEQDPDDPEAIPTSRDTPWHRVFQGHFADRDLDVAGNRYLRRHRPFHYWLNPFSKGGPFNELGSRLDRRVIAGFARPESTAGRFGMQLAALPTLGLAPLLAGSGKAQRKLRRSAAENEIYPEAARPPEKKKGDGRAGRDADSDGKYNEGRRQEEK